MPGESVLRSNGMGGGGGAMREEKIWNNTLSALLHNSYQHSWKRSKTKAFLTFVFFI